MTSTTPSEIKIFKVTSANQLNKEAVVQRYFVKKTFLKISQNLQENTCTRTHLRTPFYIEHLCWLLL